MAVDGAGNLFIADLFEGRVRIVSPNGVIATLAGTGMPATPVMVGHRRTRNWPVRRP